MLDFQVINEVPVFKPRPLSTMAYPVKKSPSQNHALDTTIDNDTSIVQYDTRNLISPEKPQPKNDSKKRKKIGKTRSSKQIDEAGKKK
jgi:hypothetical protein